LDRQNWDSDGSVGFFQGEEAVLDVQACGQGGSLYLVHPVILSKKKTLCCQGRALTAQKKGNQDL